MGKNVEHQTNKQDILLRKVWQPRRLVYKQMVAIKHGCVILPIHKQINFVC